MLLESWNGMRLLEQLSSLYVNPNVASDMYVLKLSY